ncbi:MAG: hypothetical protein A2Y54_05840 [Chloroflexi bacterium RBG_16_51_16]|nr:MAG: hypothetical protein A2Y54_05840 [Chloroflexi bacterium RBG_16_51_16]
MKLNTAYVRVGISCLAGLVLGWLTARLAALEHRLGEIDILLVVALTGSSFAWLIYNLLAGLIPKPLAVNEFKGSKAGLERSSKDEGLPGINLWNSLIDHAPGLILSAAFFIILFNIGIRLNHPGFDTTDNLLDADNFTWMQRIAWAGGYEFEMRTPHPFAYFIFRPMGYIANLILGDPFYAALFLNSLAGAVCVYLMVLLVNAILHNKTYALLSAALLGFSTAHLWFGSVIESYIFSAATLLIFFVILQTNQKSNWGLVLSSLAVFGITITNAAQTFIGFLVKNRNLKSFIRFSILVLSIAVILSVLHAAWYPSAQIFFLPSQAQAEEGFSISILREPAWRAMGRLVLLVRTVFLYTMIAPQPFVQVEEVGGTFPRFNFFHIAPGEYAYSSYDGVGAVLVYFWAALLLCAGVLFLRKTIRSHSLDLTAGFALCVLFNFLLHLQYGYEPFLYSPDWAFALVAFTVLSFGEYADQRWLQAVWMVFLVLLVINQWQFFNFVIRTITPYIYQN